MSNRDSAGLPQPPDDFDEREHADGFDETDDRAIDALLNELFTEQEDAASTRRRLRDQQVADQILTRLGERWEDERRSRPKIGSSKIGSPTLASETLAQEDTARRWRRGLASCLAIGIGLAAAVLLTLTIRNVDHERPLAQDTSAHDTTSSPPLDRDLPDAPSHRSDAEVNSAAGGSHPAAGGANQAADRPPRGGFPLANDPNLAASSSPRLPSATSDSATPHLGGTDGRAVTADVAGPLPAAAGDGQSVAAAKTADLAGGVAVPSGRDIAPPTIDQFNAQWGQYWQAIGVRPAAELSQELWQQRLQQRLGLIGQLDRDSSPEQEAAIVQLISAPGASEQLAGRLVDELSEGLTLSDQRRQQLTAGAAEALRGGQRFDHWVAEWVAQEWQQTRQAAVASQDSEDPQRWADQIGRHGQWFAQRMLGADVGCARCHDSPIDSRFSQQDYWSLAALFAPQDQPLFYELPDGRQHLATPGVPERWLSGRRGSGDDRLTQADQLAGRLIGSRRLARSLVNHLWAVGFGEPLVGSASSPVSPPIDDSLQAALELMTDRLLAADFDLRVIAAWMAQSEPMKRGVADELAGTAWQYAGEAELARASLAQRSFAAARLPWPAAQQPQLLAMMQARHGVSATRLDLQDRILAQPAVVDRPSLPGNGATPPGNGPVPAGDGPQSAAPSAAAAQPPLPQVSVNNEDYWWTQWLADRQAIQGGWLESIGDRQQQLRHAFYAAGYHEVDPVRWDAVRVLVDREPGDRDQPAAEPIAQVYWVIQQTR